MTNFKITDAIDGLKRVALPRESKARMRAELAAYADFHAVPRYALLPIRKTWFIFNNLSHIAAFSILFVLGSGTVAYAAHSSLPGSPLYAVKTDVLEPVEKLITVPQVSSAEWSVTLAKRRLDEADALASTTARAEKDEEQAAREVAHAARDVEERANKLSTPEREKALNDFSKALSSHERTLGRLAELASTTNATDTEEVLHKLFTETRGRRERDSSSDESSGHAREPQSWDNSGNGRE